MSLGKLALGVASIVLSVNHLRNAGRHFAEARPRGAAGLSTSDTGYVETVRGPMRMRLYPIKNLDDRIAHLRRLTVEGKSDPRVMAFAKAAITKKCGRDWCVREKDNLGEAKAIFDAVRQNVRYTSDIHGIDTYQKPSHTLRLRGGDCDDLSVLLCSAAMSVGIPCRFSVIRTKDSADWNHIFAEAGFPRARPQKWVSMDASLPVHFGWRAPRSMIAAERTFAVK